MALQIDQHTRLDEISESVIRDLLNNNSGEDIYIDFKEGIDSTDPHVKYSIRKSFATFSNTFGGFLFFGILDQNNSQGKSGVDRVVGVTNTTELGRTITQKYLERGLCIPLVDFEGPSIIGVNGNSVAVVKIIKSEKGPHAIKFDQDRPIEFWGRGSGTARPLDYSDLVFAIERGIEERGWVTALYLDVEGIALIASQNIKLGGMSDVLPEKYDSIITRNYGELLRVLGKNNGLVRQLAFLRRKLSQADTGRDYLLAKSALPLMNLDKIIAAGTEDAAKRATELVGLCQKMMEFLAENYPTVNELAMSKNSAQ